MWWKKKSSSGSLVEPLGKLIEAHGLSFHAEDEWIVPNGELPAIRATWFPGKHSGCLEIEVLIEDGLLLNESFAGLGAGNEGVRDAIHNFSLNSLHVLLSAFWDVHDPEQVKRETWMIGDHSYSAFVGNLGTRGSNGIAPSIPENLFHTIHVMIQKEVLTEQFYWYRHFYCEVSGDQTFEALKNNQNWVAGQENLASLDWELRGGYCSVRHFMILKRIT